MLQTRLCLWLYLPGRTPRPTAEAQAQSIPRGRIPGYGKPVIGHPGPSGWANLKPSCPLVATLPGTQDKGQGNPPGAPAKLVFRSVWRARLFPGAGLVVGQVPGGRQVGRWLPLTRCPKQREKGAGAHGDSVQKCLCMGARGGVAAAGQASRAGLGRPAWRMPAGPGLQGPPGVVWCLTPLGMQDDHSMTVIFT